MILLTYRHELRAAEVCDLRWHQVDFKRRAARAPGQERHPEHPPGPGRRAPGPAPAASRGPTSPFVFVSERGSPFTPAGLARMIERAATAAGLELKAHPHMLRHACGYTLANKGHDTRAIQGWLGQRCGLHDARAEPIQGFLAGVIRARSGSSTSYA
jgi:integrase